MGMEVDTFEAFRPHSYGEEVIEVSKRKRLDFNTNLLTSFVHYWYWDEDSNALSCELISLAMIDEGVYRNKKPYALEVYKIKAQNNTN
jgi:hypothetical protein